MNFKKYNNLIDLFFEQCEKQPKEKVFLSSLKDPKKNFSWKNFVTSIEEIYERI